MSKFAIGLLTLAMYAASLPVIAMITPAQAETSSSKHTRKYKKQVQRNPPGIREIPWSAGKVWPVTRPSSQAAVCPGIARSFECSIWPPPFDDDPDRKRAGGGG
jgi:hypothetical protein